MKKILSVLNKHIFPAMTFAMFLLVLAIFPLEYKAVRVKLGLESWGVPKRVFFYLTDVLIVLFMFLSSWKLKKKNFLHIANPLFLAFWGFVFFSVLLNFSNYEQLPRLELLSLSIAFLFFFKMVSHLNEENKRTWTHLFFFSIFLIALFESGLAFYQYFQQSPIWIRNISRTDVNKFIQLPGFFVEGGKRWIFDRWFAPSQEFEYIMRASGSLGHPNALGGFFLLSLPITFYLFYQTTSTKMRALFGIGIFVETVALTLTFSRAAIFAWIFIAVFWVFLMIRKKTIDHGLPFTLRNLRNAFFHSSMKKLSLVMALSLVFSTFCFFEQHVARGGILNYNELARASDRDRKEDYKAAFTMIKQNPFFGVGYGNFPKVRKELAPPNTKTPPTPVHSMPLLLLSETGIVGFLLFALFALSLLLATLSKRNISPIVITLFSVLMGFALVAQVDFYLWFSHNGRLLFFITAAFLTAHGTPFSLKEISYFKNKNKRISTTTV